jgi:hypothetical protein
VGEDRLQPVIEILNAEQLALSGRRLRSLALGLMRVSASIAKSKTSAVSRREVNQSLDLMADLFEWTRTLGFAPIVMAQFGTGSPLRVMWNSPKIASLNGAFNALLSAINDGSLLRVKMCACGRHFFQRKKAHKYCSNCANRGPALAYSRTEKGKAARRRASRTWYDREVKSDGATMMALRGHSARTGCVH